MMLFVVQRQPLPATQLGDEHSIIGGTWLESRGNIDAYLILKIHYLLATVILGFHIYEYVTGPSLTILPCPTLQTIPHTIPSEKRSTFNILVNSNT